MFETVKYYHVAGALGGRGGRAGTLFRRLEFDPKGAVSGRTHGLRHWVITAMLRGNLPPDKLAAWCGHASAREVSTYDHRTAAEMRAIVRRASAAGRGLSVPLDHSADGDQLNLRLPSGRE